MSDVAIGQDDASEHRVTPLELFFDLVFVFAITQVTSLLANEPTWRACSVECSCSRRSGGRGRATRG